jgi:hypothetical protein
VFCATPQYIYCQTISHPWKVIDNGGGISSDGQLKLLSSLGQPIIQQLNHLNPELSLENGYIPCYRSLSGTSAFVTIALDTNWNVVSLPLRVNDYRTTALFPHAQSSAFTYNTRYVQKDTLEFGNGYWLKFDSIESVRFTGCSVFQETLDVADKWNMIGSLSYPVNTTHIIPLGTIIDSRFFGFSFARGYFDTVVLEPGKGYWVKMKGAGKIILRVGSNMK